MSWFTTRLLWDANVRPDAHGPSRHSFSEDYRYGNEKDLEPHADLGDGWKDQASTSVFHICLNKVHLLQNWFCKYYRFLLSLTTWLCMCGTSNYSPTLGCTSAPCRLSTLSSITLKPINNQSNRVQYKTIRWTDLHWRSLLGLWRFPIQNPFSLCKKEEMMS